MKAKSLTARRKITRRNILKSAGLTTLGGTFSVNGASAMSRAPKPRIPIPTFESLGFKPIINCVGTYTSLGNSVWHPEIRLAVEEASKHYVVMEELQEVVGRRLAELTGAESGAILSGASAAIYGGMAACIVGTDHDKMQQLPLSTDTDLKNEFIVAREHICVYDAAAIATGARRVVVETPEEMEAKITDRTAMMYIWGEQEEKGKISIEEMIAIGKRRGVPVFVDCAAEKPQRPNRWLAMGADMICHSGSKILRAPAASGVILGRKDLVWAAFQNTSPHHGCGRTMKCGKEEIMGCIAALELWFNGRDVDAEYREWQRMLEYIRDEISDIPSIDTVIVKLTSEHHSSPPDLSIDWDQNVVKISHQELRKQLLEGDPRIMTSATRTFHEKDAHMRRRTGIVAYMLQPGEEKIVARRLREVLSKAAKA